MDPVASGTDDPSRPKRVWVYLGLLLLMLPVLCTTLTLRLLDLGDWRIKTPTASLVFAVALFGMKVTYDLGNRALDREGRLLSVAGFVPVSLFLLSFDAPPSIALALLVLAIITQVAGLIAAFAAKRKLLWPGSS